MKVGIVPYLNDLAQRFRSAAKTASDSKTKFALETLSIEISNKAHALGEAFTLAEGQRRPEQS